MKIVVFDDDPTGSQTVYGCPLLFHWDKALLTKGINDPSPLLFLLTNTRSLSPEVAEKRLREICKNLKEVIQENKLGLDKFFFITRGDSTLRGHSLLEPKVINEELGPFDATFHVPAFFEGGRTTVNSIHLLNGVPVHQTIFAKDKIFGFSTSHLAYWIEEKSNFQIKAKDVKSINLDQLREANLNRSGMNKFVKFLSTLSSNQPVVVDAESSKDLDTLVSGIKALGDRKRFLFRSAASLINSLSQIYPENNNMKNFSLLRLKEENGNFKPGIVLVGSHVKLADDQLQVLLKDSFCVGVELPVKKIAIVFEEEDSLLAKLENLYLQQIFNILDSNKIPVLFTSRGEISFNSIQQRMRFGIFLAQLMGRLVNRVSDRLGYIICKGGITTHILISEGLKIKFVKLKGQILPGLSVVCSCDKDKSKLPIITFPGNLGDKGTLLETLKIMESC